jgi:predicted metal-dependent HD superfamily phosphohydrolase
LVELNDHHLDTEDRIMLDSDLAGFGKVQFDTYLVTSANIRKEYSHLSDEMYTVGRIRFLSKLYAKDTIYYSEPAHESWEVKARSNIEQEIALLKSKVSNGGS